MTQDSDRERQHHRGGGRVAHPHGERRRHAEHQITDSQEFPFSRMHDAVGDPPVQTLARQGGGHREATEEQENQGIRESSERPLHIHQAERARQHRHQQRRDCQRQRFCQPEERDAREDPQSHSNFHRIEFLHRRTRRIQRQTETDPAQQQQRHQEQAQAFPPRFQPPRVDGVSGFGFGDHLTAVLAGFTIRGNQKSGAASPSSPLTDLPQPVNLPPCIQ